MGHGERRRELERQFPGWEIWYVPREPDSATWCARPQMLINADSPEKLAAAIRAAHSQVSPDSLLLASPRGYPARVRRLRKLEEPAVLPAGAQRPGKGGGFPSPEGVPPGVAERSGERPTAPLGAAGELGPRDSAQARASAGEVTAVDRCGSAPRRSPYFHCPGPEAGEGAGEDATAGITGHSRARGQAC